MYKMRSFLIVLCIATALFSCETESGFKSDFSSSQERVWIGPEYWANPMQDWQINNGALECLVRKKNRNVHLLTQKLDTTKGNLKMQVSLKVFSPQTDKIHKNWVGFSIGSKGEFNDYRDSALFGKGLNIGVTTNGNLFIGDFPEDNELNSEVQKLLSDGVKLQVNLAHKDDGYQLEVSIKTKEDVVIEQRFKGEVSAEELVGDLVLVSDFNLDKNDPKALQKSVSFKDWEISGNKIEKHSNYAFGPILFSQYTLSRGLLKLTAQMAPVILNSEQVHFQIKVDDEWNTIGKAVIDKDARTATFRFEDWDATEDIPYRLAYTIDKESNAKEELYWEGTIRAEPNAKDDIVIAGFTGNDHMGFPNTDIFNQVNNHNPDLLFFSGDQIYEPNGGYGAQRAPHDKATLDYLRKWYMYGWAYRDLMKDRPTVSITDDHDVYHGNIWGAGGMATPSSFGQGAKAQDAGGYKMPAAWVNMVERTQTSHLPDPFDATPVAQGIGVYYTEMVYGGISFAILEDRKFKSAPKALLPDALIANGWPQNKAFDVVEDADVSEAKLLGDRQLAFLETWATDWSYQSHMKMVLSQTIFVNVATLPKAAMSGAIIPTLRIMNKGEYALDDRPVSDFDSNSWPQTGRDKAVKTIRKGFAFHLAGDQHLGSTVQYGVDNWNDSGYAFCVPSISNHWPRRWYPSEEGGNRDLSKPKYTGEFKDGFGNKMTVHAVSNPLFTGKTPSRLYDRATGYGIVRMNKKERTITLECWPRQADPNTGIAEQYDGWPITMSQEDNYGREATAFLPELTIEGMKHPVVHIINETTNETLYALRLNSKKFIPKIFDDSAVYTVKVEEPDTNNWQEKKGVTPKSGSISFSF